MSIKNPTLAHFRHFSSLFTPSPLYICRETSTNQPFYAKRTQFPKKSNERKSIYYNGLWKYCQLDTWWKQTQFKANSNPIKPNLPDAQMSVNSILTKDYERNDIFAVPENKPNSNPIKANFKLRHAHIIGISPQITRINADKLNIIRWFLMFSPQVYDWRLTIDDWW